MQPTNKTIFRREALESRIKGFSNPVSIRGSLAAHVLLAGILFVAGALIIFGMVTNYTRRAVVPGYLTPADGAVLISALRAGRLLVDVADGARVSKGQRIARIVIDDADSNGRSFVDLKIRGLEQALALARERLDLARKRVAALEVQARAALDRHLREIEQARRTVESNRRALGIVRAELERDRKLARKGLVSKARLQEREKQLIRVEQELEQSKSRLEILQASTEQVRIEWQIKRVELRQAINRLEQEVHEIANQLKQAHAQREIGIFAPVSGVVTFASAQDGESVTVGTPLFRITSEHSELQAVLLAPSAAVGFVRVGDVVQIRYSAFPYREHGVFDGRVLAIDETAQLPRTIKAPIEVAEPVYRITVAIDQNPRSKKGMSLRLASGMTLEASVVIDQKPLLLWLLSPIL